jgi:D-alanyl-D-alanine dipeptidase
MVAGMRGTNARSASGLAAPDGSGKTALRQLVGGLLLGGGTQRGTVPPQTPVLLSDPRVSAVPARECGEPLTELDESFGPCRALARVSVARRLAQARDMLPRGVGLRVVDGYRTAAAQRTIISSYAAQLRVSHPAAGAAELERLTSRFVAPLAVAPHVAGAAADLTLVDSAGRGAGLVNYPTEWWHWSYGDRYWALVTGAPAALYGPVAADRVAR